MDTSLEHLKIPGSHQQNPVTEWKWVQVVLKADIEAKEEKWRNKTPQVFPLHVSGSRLGESVSNHYHRLVPVRSHRFFY